MLSRRPGVIREVVDIDIPLAERRMSDPRIAEIQQNLWDMMREEAQTADLELTE